MKQSVLHICKVFLPVAGGVQKAVAQITSSLSRFDHSVLTTGEDGAIKQQRLADAEVFRSRSYGQIASLPIAPSLIGKTITMARDHNLIAVHYPFPLAELALLFVPFAPPIVVHWHSEIVAQKKLKWLVAPLTLLILLRSSAIVVTSKKMVTNSWFLKLFNRKTHLIPYGLAPGPKIAAGDSNEPPYFLLIGRHVSYKGMEIAIRAMASISSSLIIAGDGPLFDQHVELIKTLGLEDRIKLVRSATDEDINKLIAGTTALIVPSVQENEAFALVQLEAMRQEKPIINTNLKSSVPWVARSEIEAITVEPRNSKDLSLAMNRLLENPELAQSLGKAGLQRFNSEFSEAKFRSRIEQLYCDLVSDLV